MSAVAVAVPHPPVVPLPPSASSPRLMLPPRAEPPAVLTPAERAGALLPQIRSVLSPVTEAPWSVAPAAPRPAREVLADPTDLCGSLVLAAVEVLSGRRPLVQLTRWVTPQVMELLGSAVQRQEGSVSPSRGQVRAGVGQTARGAIAPARRGRATVRRVHLSRVNAGAAEASVVLHDGERVRAAAVRLEVHRGHWRATVLQIG